MESVIYVTMVSCNDFNDFVKCFKIKGFFILYSLLDTKNGIDIRFQP